MEVLILVNLKTIVTTMSVIISIMTLIIMIKKKTIKLMIKKNILMSYNIQSIIIKDYLSLFVKIQDTCLMCMFMLKDFHLILLK